MGQNLTRASKELFRRPPDEVFPSLEALIAHCEREKNQSQEVWSAPKNIQPVTNGDTVTLTIHGSDGAFALNDWSFTQFCRTCEVSRDTLNKLSAGLATKVLEETLPRGQKPLQLLTLDGMVRALHPASYTRLYNHDLLNMVLQVAPGFEPPQVGISGGTGLYAGDRDMFCFLVDKTGWVEINGEAFAPGYFVWNSECGARTVGIQTFWFQAVCQNHIVWDCIDITSFSRRHTTNVGEAMSNIQQILSNVVAKRDERKDGFYKAIQNAMKKKVAANPEQALELLAQEGFTRTLAKQATELAEQSGRFTIFSLVDALTRLSQQSKFAGDRAEVDAKAGRLLSLAA